MSSAVRSPAARLGRSLTPRASIAAVLLFGVSVAAAPAQQQGSIAGTVTGEDGEPVPFAQVVLEGTGMGGLADEQGAYLIEGVPPGTYTLRVDIIGYRTETETVTVATGEQASEDVDLEPDILNMEAVVTTGTRAPRVKLETSTAVTNLSEDDIEQAAPRSTADLLKTVPGFYVESSGGEVGGNLFARGLPADGSFRYVALLEEGMPVYDSTELFFVNADILVRVDENVQQVEAVRGGSASLFSSNAPGGLVNFISKTGGPEHSGTVEVKGGTDGLGRAGANVNGPLGESWRYSVGGFFRLDDGVRSPGFTASEGGQIKANVTRAFDRGYLRIFGKYLNDSNIFFLPLPLQNPTDPDFVPGFPDDGTLTTEEGVDNLVPLPGGGQQRLPLDDGQRQDGGSAIVDFGFDLGGGWRIENTARYMDVDHSWNAIVPFELRDADEFAQGFVEDTPGGASADLLFTNVLEGGARQPFDTGNDLLLLAGQWLVEKPLSNISDQLQLRRAFGRHDVTVGTYVGYYEAENRWFFNDVLTDVRDEPHFVDLQIRDAAGNVIRRVTNDGFRQYLPLYVNGDGNVTHYSFFAGDQIAVTDRLDLDLGVRFEHDSFEQRVENTSSFDVPGGTDAHTGLNFGTGTFRTLEDDFDEWAVSAGANYRLSEQAAVYARGGRGYKMPILDQFLFAADDANLQAEQLVQAEAGLKVASPRVGLSAVAYWLQLKDFPTQDAQVDPVTGETEFVTTFAGEARTIGAEVEAVVAPADPLRLNATVTLQDPEFTEFGEGQGAEDLSGNRVRRIPQVLLDLGAAYSLAELTLRGDWRYVDDRFSNNSNTIVLDSYSTFDLGASYDWLDQGVTFFANLQNVTDEGPGALTEGNPRVDEQLGAAATLFLARPVLPRRLTAGVRYGF
ncbi:MAG: TonB-dependent receptor [Gemmatimonadota bacterium]